LNDEDDDRDERNAEHLCHLDALAVLGDGVGVAQASLDLDRSVRGVGLSRRLVAGAGDAVAESAAAVLPDWRHATEALAHRPPAADSAQFRQRPKTHFLPRDAIS